MEKNIIDKKELITVTPMESGVNEWTIDPPQTMMEKNIIDEKEWLTFMPPMDNGVNNEGTIDPPQTNDSEEWRKRIIKSKCAFHIMKSKVFFASLDQTATNGGGACSVIAALSASWLLSAPDNGLPTEAKFNRLISQGSHRWRILKQSANPDDARNNYFFHIDTVLEAGIGSIAIDYGRSHFASFDPDAHASVKNIWGQLAAEEDFPRVYIVRWNSHFFVLKAESRDVFYIMDSLGCRFGSSSVKDKGFIVRFDSLSAMYYRGDGRRFPWEVAKGGPGTCLAYLECFLAAVALRGRYWDEVGPKLTQIDFNYVHRVEKSSTP